MKKILKTVGYIIVGIIATAYILYNLAAWMLRPERLTPLLEHVLTEAVDGEVTLGRAEVKWRPGVGRVTVEIDDVTVVSHAFRRAPDALRRKLTAADDSLLRVNHITAEINVAKALRGSIEVGDVIIDAPEVNLVVADGNLANFDIEKPHPGRKKLPMLERIKGLKELKINSVKIVDAPRSHYRSLVDGERIEFTIPDFTLDGSNAPDYTLAVSTEVTSESLRNLNLYPLLAGAKGGVKWDYRRPNVVELDNIHFGVNDIDFIISTEVDFSGGCHLNTLDFTINRLSVSTLISHFPATYADACAGVSTDLEFTLNLNLVDTLVVTNLLKVPSARMSLEIPDCELRYGDTYLTKARMRAHAYIDGAELNRSVVTVDDLYAEGTGFALDATATATNLLDDPSITATVKGDVALASLPKELLRRFPATISGVVEADAGVKMRASDLTREDFNRIVLSGGMTVTGLDLAMNRRPVTASAHRAVFTFGATSDYSVRERIAVDSLMSFTLAVDTASVRLPGNQLEFSSLLADIGTPLSGSVHKPLTDRVGALIRLGMFTFDAHDSVRVRVREIETAATLSPDDTLPQCPELDFTLTARRLTARGRGFGVAISQPVAEVKSHQLPASHARRHMRLPKRGHINELDTIIEEGDMDWNVATGLQHILLGWDVEGTLKSNAGFIFIHDFPLRQRASAIDLRFNNDSVIFNSLRYSAGKSAFDVTGSVSNVTRAFTSYDRAQPLVADLDLSSQFVDINELVVTSLHETAGNAGPDPDYTEQITEEHQVKTDTTATRPLIIPRNIDAELRLKADSVLYSDLMMHDLTGSLLVSNSALNLHNLRAATAAGSVDLCGLYWAPDSANIRFGMGLQLTNFDLGRTLRFIPALGRMLPALRGFTGEIDAQMAATTDLTPHMDFDMDSFRGAVKLEGDSLALVDPDRFRSLSRWLMFHDHKHIDIDHMDVEMVIANRRVDIFPFIFDIDRYKLGVMGNNNLAMDLNYHVSVLKSPLPFKFGINITGPARHPKIRLGGAKIRPGMVEKFDMADSMRLNLVKEIRTVFDLGTMSHEALNLPNVPIVELDEFTDSLSDEETQWMRREGWLPADQEAEIDDAQKVDTPAKRKKHFWIF